MSRDSSIEDSRDRIQSQVTYVPTPGHTRRQQQQILRMSLPNYIARTSEHQT
jgi:hypothetical protein